MNCKLNMSSLHPGGLRLTDRAARLAGVSHGMSIVDIGCGNGATLRYLRDKYNAAAVGIDISLDLIAQGREADREVDFICCDAMRPPCEAERFDIALCECSLSETEDPVQVLRQIHNLLKPGGKLILSDVCAKKAQPFRWCPDPVADGTGFDVSAGSGIKPEFPQQKKPSRQPFTGLYPNSKNADAELWTRRELIDLITENCYNILIEEDHTPALVTYAAERYGSGCTGLSYTLIVAEKL